MRVRTATSLVAASVLAATAQAERVYFGTGGDGIYTGTFDVEKGELGEVSRAFEARNPGFLAKHPSLPLLYAVVHPAKVKSANGEVVALKINADGSLTELNRRSSEGLEPCHVSVDPAGEVVLAANYITGSVIAYGVETDGSLAEHGSLRTHEGSGENPQRQEAPHAHSVFANPAGTHAYVVDLGIDQIVIYEIDAKKGALEPAGSVEVPGGGIGPRHMVWAADGKHAFVVNELDLSLSTFKAGAEPGSLAWVETQSILPEDASREKMSSAEIRMHPNGAFLYVSIRDLARQERDAISVFSVKDGEAKRIATTPAKVSFPRNFNLDPSGRWMLIGGQRSHDVAIFSIDPRNGLITHKENVPRKPGPICVEFAGSE